MLLEALSALMLASAAQAEAPPQSAAGRPLEDLLLAMRSHCPPMVPRVRSAGPDELMRLETGFRDQLPPPDRSRLDQARARAQAQAQRGGAGRCDARGGASCQADAALSAILDSGQMGAFTEYVCARETAAIAPR